MHVHNIYQMIYMWTTPSYLISDIEHMYVKPHSHISDIDDHTSRKSPVLKPERDIPVWWENK